MQRLSLAVLVSLSLLYACTPAEQPAAPAQAEHMATGTLNSVDVAAGTVNVSHGAVPSAGWPQMTMDFKLADPGMAAELKAGERVDIHFRIDNGMNATITEIAPIK